MYLRVAAPQHESTKARDEWLHKRQARAAQSILHSLQQWRSQSHKADEDDVGGEESEEA